MNELRQAAEMALEALEDIFGKEKKDVGAINALRQALHSTKFLPEEMDAYERGFIEGRQDQMRSTVERAVNAMAKREWVGLTDEEIKKIAKKHKWHEGNVEPHLMPVFRSLEAKLKEKNNGN